MPPNSPTEHFPIDGRPVVIDYTNWQGHRTTRTIVPKNFYFGSTEFHPTRQWLLTATDVTTPSLPKERTFAVKDIHSWAVKPDPAP